jgi:two-component system chemotaxis response regulator CheY
MNRKQGKTKDHGREERPMGKRIMTVDDSTSVRQMVGFTLKQAGYEIVEAQDGRDALAKLNNGVVHMVITDLNMPNLDGIGLIREVRRDGAGRFVPIVMLTTESQDSQKHQAKAAGATGWIIKPFKPEQLLAVVKKVLG